MSDGAHDADVEFLDLLYVVHDHQVDEDTWYGVIEDVKSSLDTLYVVSGVISHLKIPGGNSIRHALYL